MMKSLFYTVKTMTQRPISIVLGLLLSNALLAADQKWRTHTEVFFSGGDDRSYYGIATLYPWRQTDNSLTYIDARYVDSDVDTHEFNLGIGYRRLNREQDQIYGSYAAADFRKSASGRQYRQLTLGLETLSHYWDYRANLYLPLTDSEVTGQAPSFTETRSEFIGFNLIETTTVSGGGDIVEEALSGFDFEMGRLIKTYTNYEMRAFIGAYRYRGDAVDDITGGRLRLEARPLPYLTVNFSIENDPLFKTRGMLEIRLALGRQKSQPDQGSIRSVRQRMTQFVQRDIDIRETSRIAESKRTQNQKHTQVNTTTAIEGIAHIDNSADSNGDGSIEHPYNSIANCQAQTIDNVGCQSDSSITKVIYIHTGDSVLTDENQNALSDQSQARLYQGQIALQPEQWLIGDGVFEIGGVNFNGSGIRPVLSSNQPSGALITANEHTHIAGLQLGRNDDSDWTASESAIDITNVSNVILENLLITGRADSPDQQFNDGIRITAHAGTQMNNIVLSNLAVGVTEGDGIAIQAEGDPTTDITSQTVTLTSVASDSNQRGLYVNASHVNQSAGDTPRINQTVHWNRGEDANTQFGNRAFFNQQQGILITSDGQVSTQQTVSLRQLDLLSNGGAGLKAEFKRVAPDAVSRLDAAELAVIANEGGGIGLQTLGGASEFVIGEQTLISGNINNPDASTPTAGDDTGFGIILENDSSSSASTQSLLIQDSRIEVHAPNRSQVHMGSTVDNGQTFVNTQTLVIDNTVLEPSAGYRIEDNAYQLVPETTTFQVSRCQRTTSGQASSHSTQSIDITPISANVDITTLPATPGNQCRP